MTDSVLEVSEVSKSFRRRRVLDGCSFTVKRGSITALVGSNGAGKSTLMAVIVGLLTADSGEIRVLEGSAGQRGISPGLSYLAQHKPLFARFTVTEMLRFGRETNDRWDHAYAARLVDEAGIHQSSKVKQLSPGQRTRVAIALVLGRSPEVVLLDEPLADLDPVARRDIARTLMADAAERGTTIVLSSHVLAELTDVADRLLLLGDGKMQLDGDTDELVSEHFLMTGTGDPGEAVKFSGGTVIGTSLGVTTSTHVVRGRRPSTSAQWQVLDATLDDVVLAHLSGNGAGR